MDGQVKADEANIKSRLDTLIPAIVVVINASIEKLDIRLPELSFINYSISFAVQEDAIGAGLTITKK